MRAKITVQYEFISDNEPCLATITLYVPTCKDGREIIPEIIGANIGPFNLTPYWGSYENGFRSYFHQITTTSWEELQKEVNAIVEEIVRDLKAAWKRGKELRSQKPENKEVIIELD